eukprot:CAMPEP_0117593132 /NCGR_PEP_ID=MMETSP0784-20121206/72459_1 /TAXON_ID=39447 /ORGANISM="" /LENGTH=76 /DNA_ID=CAMNT_0005395013 /DNA_START=317 /DNA_END=547 /DNA_ORIENTATION=-
MDDTLRVDVPQAAHELQENVSRHMLGQAARPGDFLQQLTAVDVLHDKVKLVLFPEYFVQLNHMSVPESEQRRGLPM